MIRLQTTVAAASADESEAADFSQKIEALRGIVADKSMEAETTRTEILRRIDVINATGQQMAEASKQQRSISLYVAAIAVLGNIILLFILTRITVERPLHRLTAIVKD